MHFLSAKTIKERKSADVIVLPFWQGKKEAEAAFHEKGFSSLVSLPLDSGDFKGKEGETLILFRHKDTEAKALLLGLGSKEKCTLETFRRAYASATKAIQKKNKSMNILLPESESYDCDLIAQAICESVLLTNYSFDVFKSGKEDNRSILEKVTFIGGSKDCLKICKKTATVISSVNYVRDLVNGNADDVTPERLASEAKQLEKEFSQVKTTVLHRKQLEKEKMGLILAVSRGAEVEPALITIEYKGDPKSKDYTAIVGKGITFDTGGLNIKGTGNMETMKCDMAGSAAVLGTIQAIASLELPVNVIGVLAATENAIGPSSYKPGDVYKSHLGKTVEITNTDAEGRLVLADAISYTIKHFKPARIVDLATLTGGIVVALGEEATGLFSNNDALANALINAGEKTHERLWRFPLYPEYKDYLKSSIADFKNSGARKASSITAAIFIQYFVQDVPWAHLDIAGTAYLSELKPYHPTHATGVGVRLLVEYLESLSHG